MTTSLETLLGHHFQRPELLEQALTHRSFHFENRDLSLGHNERFEFLGDAVLDLALSDLLMQQFSQASEGELSQWRASLVNESTLATLAQVGPLSNYVKLGRGELQNQGQLRPRLLASTFEAIVGAIYIDADYATAKEFVVRQFANKLSELGKKNPEEDIWDHKTHLQELIQEKLKVIPQYDVVSATGPDHDKTFVISVSWSGAVMAQGQGKSKKQAEQDAARQALQQLKTHSEVQS